MAEVNWTPQSISDIDQIAKFIARESLKFAKIQVLRFFEVVLVLEKLPKLGRIVPEFDKSNIREIILGNYRIVYKIISTQKIDILAVHHSSRILKISRLRRKKH